MKGGITIEGQFVPEGVVVGVSAYVVYHVKEIFPEPWRFQPERWIPAGRASREDLRLAREAMCAFSLGKRGCIEKRLAFVEIRIAVASLIWSYDVEEAKFAGQNGCGGSNRKDGRRRRDEFQLFNVLDLIEKGRSCIFDSGAERLQCLGVRRVAIVSKGIPYAFQGGYLNCATITSNAIRKAFEASPMFCASPLFLQTRSTSSRVRHGWRCCNIE